MRAPPPKPSCKRARCTALTCGWLLQIVGKRLRVQVDGQKILKVLLDPSKATELEYKLDAFSTVYRKLTNKEAIFEFPIVPQE